MKGKERTIQKVAGIFGLASVSIFLIAFFLFAYLHPDFKILNDNVSKLGATGQPNAVGWNVIGFFFVGILFLGFGIAYGKYLKDRLVAVLLSFFGFGFALTAIPIDLINANSPLSKAHIVAITLGLASWLFALARISTKSTRKFISVRANITAVLLVAAMLGYVAGLWSMPLTHRLVFGLVFGWTIITATDLLQKT